MGARLFSPLQLKPFTLQQRVVSRPFPGTYFSTMAENFAG